MEMYEMLTAIFTDNVIPTSVLYTTNYNTQSSAPEDG